MIKKHIFAIVLAILQTPFFAFAQEITNETIPTNVNELTVTANRFSQKISETAKNVSIVTKQDLERSKGQTLAQVLQNQAGITIAGANNNFGSPLSLFTRGASRGQTLVLLNGLPINDASFINSDFDLNSISIEQLQRIEIVKSSQSTLYGSDAIGGVINLVTHGDGAEESKFSPFVTLQGGSFNTGQINTGFDVNKDGRFANLQMNHKRSEGFSDAEQPLTSSAIFDNDGYKTTNILLSAGQKYNDGILRFWAAMNQNKGGIDNGAFSDDSDFTYKTQNASFGLNRALTVNKLTLNSNLKFDISDRQFENDSAFVAPTAFGNYSKEIYKANTFYADIFVKYNFSKNLSAMIGADHKRQIIEQNSYFNTSFGAFTEEIKDSNFNISSVYAVAFLKFNDKFFLEAGSRMNFHSVYGSNPTFNFSPSYKFNDKIRAFANVSSGFKAPSMYQLFSAYGNRGLEPEKSFSTDLGLQYTDNELNIKGTLFRRTVNDGIFFSTDPKTFLSKYINLSVQNDLGIELESSVKVENFTITANYAYLTGETTTQNNEGRDTTYNNLFRRSAHTINFGVGYQIAKNFFVKLSNRYVGERNDLFFNDTTFETEVINLNDYVLIDAYAEYTFAKKYKAFVQINNLLNTKYTDIVGFNTRPMNFTVGLTARF